MPVEDRQVAINPLDDVTINAVRSWIASEETWLLEIPSDELSQPAFRAIAVDLDEDGEDEILLRYEGFWQGTGGGGLIVLSRRDAKLVQISRLTLGHLPVGVLPSTSNGWRDLTVRVAGGGSNAKQVRLMFNGQSYPSNPSISPVVSSDKVGVIAISEETPSVAIFNLVR